MYFKWYIPQICEENSLYLHFNIIHSRKRQDSRRVTQGSWEIVIGLLFVSLQIDVGFVPREYLVCVLLY